jgi:hypothetical protein
VSAAFNGWSGGGTVHWPATHNRLVPLCVEGEARRSHTEVPDPDPESPQWAVAIPVMHAICDDEALDLTCPDCIAWRHA